MEYFSDKKFTPPDNQPYCIYLKEKRNQLYRRCKFDAKGMMGCFKIDDSCENIIFIDCVFYNAISFGVLVRGKNCLFIDCIVRDIEYVEGKSPETENNVQGWYIYGEGNTIIGCTSHNVSSNGVLVNGKTDITKYNVVLDHTSYSNKRGVQFAKSDNSRFNNLHCYNNREQGVYLSKPCLGVDQGEYDCHDNGVDYLDYRK